MENIGRIPRQNCRRAILIQPKRREYPLWRSQLTELLTSALEGYAYRLKLWISNMSNPFTVFPGLRAVAEEKLKTLADCRRSFIAVAPL